MNSALNERKRILSELINFQGSLDVLRNNIARLDWDSNCDLVFVTKDHLTGVLNRYCNADLAATEIEEWANLIENREDIGVRGPHAEEVRRAIFELANPSLAGAPFDDVVKRVMAKLKS